MDYKEIEVYNGGVKIKLKIMKKNIQKVIINLALAFFVGVMIFSFGGNVLADDVDVDEIGECYDWDGDGWGWDGEKGCRMDGGEVEDTDKPSCEIYTNTVSTEEKGVTLHWYYNGDITRATVDGIGEVTNEENWKWLEYSGVTDFTMTVENNEGETATCRVEIEYVDDKDLVG
jgi:hypothetical protein